MYLKNILTLVQVPSIWQCCIWTSIEVSRKLDKYV